MSRTPSIEEEHEMSTVLPLRSFAHSFCGCSGRSGYARRVAAALCRSGVRRASATAAPPDVGRSVALLEERVSALQERVESLEKQTPARFRAAQYNILSSYLGNNREPWFLFGALSQSAADRERARQVSSFSPSFSSFFAWSQFPLVPACARTRAFS